VSRLGCRPRVMREPIVRGRTITEQDTASTPNVVVVNEAFVKQFFKAGKDPIGQRLGLDLPKYGATYQIVGVVRNANYNWDFAHRHKPRPLFFVPLAQRTTYDDPLMQTIDDATHYIEGAVLKLHGSMEGLEPQARRVLSEVDPNITLLSVKTLQEHVESHLDQQRASAQMTALFGLLALALAGADRRNVIELVLRGAFLQILIGLAIGIPISIGCSRLIANQLYQVKGWDPLVLSMSIFALGLCALVASIIPAQRAACINPVNALRLQ